MHEMGIANSILDAVRKEMAPYPGARPVKVTVRIGTMAGVDPDSLTFCFQALVSGTEFEPMELAVETAPADELELGSLELEEPS
ncbi:fragment of hydrogenase nickel incorporation protein HypA [Candidatus Sulfopaludibacter sp. SbA3]|nr:fragment of hydrogenase nickel incorporation protein HypA [Candidatus Sulfopaludibacter sp. SbA3]